MNASALSRKVLFMKIFESHYRISQIKTFCELHSIMVHMEIDVLNVMWKELVSEEKNNNCKIFTKKLFVMNKCNTHVNISESYCKGLG